MSARIFLGSVFAVVLGLGQRAAAFDAEAYRAHLARTRDLTGEQLIQSHRPYGPYLVEVPASPSSPDFLAPIVARYQLTGDEQDLLRRHGFVVSERLAFPSFGHALDDVWHADLPVFVSTDAILHALHRSYVKILSNLETSWLSPLLGQALDDMHAAWPAMNSAHAGEPRLREALEDVDLYFTVARSLLAGQKVPSRGGTDAQVTEILRLIAAEGPASYQLFNEVPRNLDFSQMKVRGHYTQSPELKRYFQSMMWLGRTEFRLTEPPDHPELDTTREILGAFLVRELVGRTAAAGKLAAMDRLLRALVGAPDNVTLPELDDLAAATGLGAPEQLLDPRIMARFRAELATGRYTAQGINSQILISPNPMQPGLLDPPYAFLLLGQRFILDSYIAWNVVFDRIQHRGRAVFRGLPSTLDILYSLGNDDVLPLLHEELGRYHYAPNLSALRYLIDGYEPGYWRQSLYTSWLQAIRSLAKSGRDVRAPDFMRTAAWQQQKMNTQLAAWAELRHDNLLYAKQSYTGGAICSFPRTFVEPVPEFYRALERFALDAGVAFERPAGLPGPISYADQIRVFFQRMAAIMAQLATIADKELQGTSFTPEERTFLCEVLYHGGVCGAEEQGWHRELYFGHGDGIVKNTDLIVADIHTQPTDEDGGPVGYVLHGATGLPEMGVFLAAPPGEPLTAFVGPVSSYHEHVTSGFQRLTDEEWRSLYETSPPARPDWTYVYLADAQGNARTTGRRLVPDEKSTTVAPRRVLVELAQNVPNPFNPVTSISFRLEAEGGADVSLAIYDTRGRLVRTLLRERLPSGTHHASWDGKDQKGNRVHTGIYYARILAGDAEAARKMALLE